MIYVKNYAQEITRLYGKVKRCRGCYIYTAKNTRLVDMYQEEGRAILGWSFGKSKLVFKNLFDRCLTGSFETAYTAGLEKAVCALLPEFTSVCFCEKNIPSDIPTWRPWQKEIKHNGIVEVLVPFPWSGNFKLLAFTKDFAGVIPTETTIPGVLGASIARSFYDLKKEIPNRSEADFSLYDDILSLYFEREGAYLYPRVSPDKYEAFFNHCLRCKILISPDYSVPSVIPYGADVGVFIELKRNPFEFNAV